jgi:hypothetical protein
MKPATPQPPLHDSPEGCPSASAVSSRPRPTTDPFFFVWRDFLFDFRYGGGVARDGFLLERRNWRASMWTKFWQNYFLGKGFAKTSAHLFLNSDVANGKGGVWGGIFHLLLFLFGGNLGRTSFF